MLDTVSNWKDDWILKVYEQRKPAELTTCVWDDLIRYWNLPSSIKVSNSCSASRLTKDEHGNRPMLHTTSQKPQAGVRLEMVIKYFNYFIFFNIYIYSNFLNVFRPKRREFSRLFCIFTRGPTRTRLGNLLILGPGKSTTTWLLELKIAKPS